MPTTRFLIAALLIVISPAPLPAADGPEAGFAARWDFDKPGDLGGWTPLRGAGTYDAGGDVLAVTAKSMRPCLDLHRPFAADDIVSIEVRIRGIRVERETPGGSAGAMAPGGNRVRVRPEVYQGTRLYFARSKQAKFDISSSLELDLPLDGEFHVISIDPRHHASWRGTIEKLRFDVGDFPHSYELDYIHFRRQPSGGSSTEKTK
jgi:hypothetical protein